MGGDSTVYDSKKKCRGWYNLCVRASNKSALLAPPPQRAAHTTHERRWLVVAEAHY